MKWTFEKQMRTCAPKGQPATAQGAAGAALGPGVAVGSFSPNGARCAFSAFQAAVTVAALLVAVTPCLADENDADDPQQRAERLEIMKGQAAAYTLTFDKSSAKLALHDEPVLRFSNPVSGVPDGIVAMWKDGQRPAVFAQVFQTKTGLWVHEVQSLAAGSLTMTQQNTTFWQPQEPCEEFRRLTDAPAAAGSAGRRLVQMKALAGEFSAADDFKISSTDKEPTRHELRMLPTPIYRYADPDAGIEDGAVFAFVHGTDPEVFLVLESRAAESKSGKTGTPGWHYTLAPMTCWAVTVQRQGKEVWSLPERLNKSKPNHLYHVWLHKPAK
ncbi:MAG: hypothetical protein L0211_22905 [Planctomycetaceae bacterium]|nr:hypothetical protein [Planctomycetaceae bacterium]